MPPTRPRPRKPRTSSAAPTPRAPFHKKGLTYFWVFNDRCDLKNLEPQFQAFAADPNITAVCLHPRPGLLLPYGGSDWFDFIRAVCQRCRKLGIDVWLYDEDPYPSGSAGGRIVAEHPEFLARQIDKFEYDPTAQGDPTIFGFPVGKLIWCGFVDTKSDKTVDLTTRVGMLRRNWQVWENWDSRNFYPDTPRYSFQRADTSGSEFALQVPTSGVPAGMKLVAFVARQSSWDSSWGGLQDTLNPDCTRLFLQLTHEKYLASVGDMFGKEIKAIFTDEPKCMAIHPWTPGIFDQFRAKFGYDLRPRLYDLYSDDLGDRPCLTRLHYRQYMIERFEEAWLKPVSQWCRDHNLHLVGHISPEDDPVEQTLCLGNLFPTYKHFSLAGLDVIIPAMGDKRHPLLNIGITAAVSNQQQQVMMGTMSETGACAGDSATAEWFGRQLSWQTVMGLTSPLVHCAYSSVRGPRAYEYPPNYGPNGPLWAGMGKIHAELARLQAVNHGARHVAPVAILWTIRSFNMQNIDWQLEPTGMRRSITATLSACLDRQVGTHFIDESVLWDIPGAVSDGQITLGLARYSHLLIPACTVLHARTVAKLQSLKKAGVSVVFTGHRPTRQQTDDALKALDLSAFPEKTPAEAVAGLPRAIAFEGDATDIRCTAWEKDGKTSRLLISLREEAFTGKAEGRTIKLAPGKAEIL